MTVRKAANELTVAPAEAQRARDECRPGRIRLSFPPTPESIGGARSAVDALLSDEPRRELGDRLKLVVSELMTNAVTHGAPGEGITLGLTLYVRHAHVSVYNSGPPIELTRFRRHRPDGGRGLTIVAALVDGWSIETGPRGTTVTARVPRAP
jgi:anti-sigma regulatory factor (Ser/Thr protein kinase)